MNNIILKNISIFIDVDSTRQFYNSQTGFACDCIDCTTYVKNIPNVKKLFNGLDDELGIDLYKDVGKDIDELMQHDFEDYHLDVIPYYVIGECFLNNKKLERENLKSLGSNNEHAELKLADDLSLIIINTSDTVKIDNFENNLTIWLEYKTRLKKIQ